MQPRPSSGNRFGMLGIGVAACAACCAVPILALLGGLSLAGLASTLVIGTSGLVIAAAATTAFVAVRRRRTPSAARAAGPVPVEAPRAGQRPPRA